MKALATELNVDIDTLEQEMNAMEHQSEIYQDLPRWVRWLVGRGWLGASRQEYRKMEIFFVVMCLLFASGLAASFITGEQAALRVYLSLGGAAALLGAYVISLIVRVGDRFDVWSRLEATLPKRGLFGLGRETSSS